MSWDKIDNHLFENYCVEGEDKEFCNLMEEHDAEIRTKTIDDFREHLENEISENTIWGMLPIDCKDSIADEIVEYMIDIFKKIAEQMKEEGE